MSVDVDVVNEALTLVGYDGAPVTGSAPSFDTSIAGKIAARIYVTSVQAVARQNEWDFSRQVAALTLSGNAAPFPWAYEYLYPALAVQIWQIAPPSLADMNNPLPIEHIVGNSQIASVSTKVIWSNQVSASAIYNGLPPVSTWDAGFRAAVVRLLGSEFAIAGAGKPDLSQSMLEAYGAFAGAAADRTS